MTDDAIQLIARKAADGLYIRQAITAHNIANSGTPGFVPLRVDFEDALRAATSSDPASINAVRPSVRPQTGTAGVTLDLELATAAETSVRYNALLESIDRLLALDSLAVRGD